MDVCHHELLHAVSDHSVSKKKSAIIYKSGLKIQYYIDGQETCHFKGLNEGFDFVNPNELDRCGCGESFRV